MVRALTVALAGATAGLLAAGGPSEVRGGRFVPEAVAALRRHREPGPESPVVVSATDAGQPHRHPHARRADRRHPW